MHLNHYQRWGDNAKKNCWEFMACGREPEGANVHELGICPAALEWRLDGIHDGISAGRSCWVVEATICHGNIQGDFSTKNRECAECTFYERVRDEEGDEFMMTYDLLKMIE